MFLLFLLFFVPFFNCYFAHLSLKDMRVVGGKKKPYGMVP